jgi:hypothetical protein
MPCRILPGTVDALLLPKGHHPSHDHGIARVRHSLPSLRYKNPKGNHPYRPFKTNGLGADAEKRDEQAINLFF